MKVSYQLEANFRYHRVVQGIKDLLKQVSQKKSKKDFVSSFKVNETQIYSP